MWTMLQSRLSASAAVRDRHPISPGTFPAVMTRTRGDDPVQ
jgi:hypothetical protein